MHICLLISLRAWKASLILTLALLERETIFLFFSFLSFAFSKVGQIEVGKEGDQQTFIEYLLYVWQGLAFHSWTLTELLRGYY